MSNAETATAKCLACGRVRHFRTAAAAASARPAGRVCAAKARAAAASEAVAGYSPAQVAKALQLIEDGGLVPTNTRGTFTAVSADGQVTYLVTLDTCGCKAGQNDRNCYHRAAVAITLTATTRKAA